MNLDISLRQRPFPGLTEAAIRRLQTGIWLSTLMLAIALNVVTLPQFLDGTLEVSGFNLTPAEREDFRGHLAELGISAHTFAIIGLAGTTLQDALVIGLSLVLLRKRSDADWFAWYVSIVMVAGTAAMYPPAVHDLVDGSRFWVVVGKAVTALAVTSLFLIPLLFPTGRFAPRWMVAPAAFISAGVLSFVISPGTDGGGDLAHPAEALANVALLALVAGSIVYRYRRRATPIQQQQMKWGMTGAAIAMPAFLLGDALLRAIDGTATGVLAMVGWSIAMPLASLAFPVCLTVGILRHRLWDIDLYLSRTLIWVAMSALVIAAYVVIVFGIGSLIAEDQTTALSLVAVALTSVFFQPVREYLQQRINRLLFGNRDEPYAVVRQLAADLAETVHPLEALRSTVRTLTEALRLPYAAITLDPDSLPVTRAGHPGPTAVALPLVYQSQSVGTLIVSPRIGSREFDNADLRLLDDLAHQIALVAHNVRLTHDLQISRERIVSAREEERRRLRRDLHDGLGAQLAAISMQASAMKAAIRTDPESAENQASELQHELHVAVSDIRRLVQGLRPASLDDLGLFGALQNRIATVNFGEGNAAGPPALLVSLDATADLSNLPAAVEVAVYRIVDEALTNVVRHSCADRCEITIALTMAEIQVTIEDNGLGIPADRVSGVGLQSMRERALELGGSFEATSRKTGGARIFASLPRFGNSP